MEGRACQVTHHTHTHTRFFADFAYCCFKWPDIDHGACAMVLHGKPSEEAQMLLDRRHLASYMLCPLDSLARFLVDSRESSTNSVARVWPFALLTLHLEDDITSIDTGFLGSGVWNRGQRGQPSNN